VVERPAQRECPIQRNGTERRLEAHATAQRRRNPDRSAGIRAERASRQTGHDRNRRAAARTARAATGVVGIASDAPPWVGGADAVGKLVEIGLAEDDGAGRPQPGDDRGIARRDPVLQDARAGRRSKRPRREQVLHRDRYAQQRTALAPGESPLSPLCLPAGLLARRCDEGVQARARLDPPGVGVHQLDRRQPSPAQCARDLDKRC